MVTLWHRVFAQPLGQPDAEKRWRLNSNNGAALVTQNVRPFDNPIEKFFGG